MSATIGTPTSTPSTLSAWLLAIRPKTLPAAVAPVLVGCAVAWHEGGFTALPALAAFAVALLLQIGANLANDVADFHRGADTAGRLGPVRVGHPLEVPRHCGVGVGHVPILRDLRHRISPVVASVFNANL